MKSVCIIAGAAVFLTGCASAQIHDAPARRSRSRAILTAGWTQVPLTFQIQHPYDLNLAERYQFDPATDTHDFWVYFTDKPHAPPPNQTNARTEMRLPTYHFGEHMFDAEVNVSPGTFACIMQVFDAHHGPVVMLIAHPDGTVTVRGKVVKRDAIGHWWNLKVTNDPTPGGKIRIYTDNVRVATFPSRGPRAYYFKCGVYSRKGSNRSEARFRNLKIWVKPDQPLPSSPNER